MSQDQTSHDERSGERAFTESVAEAYRSYMVPLQFQAYAELFADLVAGRPTAKLPTRDVLELAAGTGVLTRAVAGALPSAHIVATDLAPTMLAEAERDGVPGNVELRQADALDLPFRDQSFDLVLHQFGVMFFPDKRAAFAETRRVLRPDGELVFVTWDEGSEHKVQRCVAATLDGVLGQAMSSWQDAVIFGYGNQATITADVEAAGLRVDTVAHLHTRLRAETPDLVAKALCLGTPMRNAIEAHPQVTLEQAVREATRAVAERFGDGPVETDLAALLVSATRPSH